MIAALEPVNALIEKARDRFMQYESRERLLLGVGAIAVLITVLFLGVIEPLAERHKQNAARLEASREISEKLALASAKLEQSHSPTASFTAGKNLSLMAAVDEASKNGSLGKSPSRIQPSGDKEVRVWLEDTSFDAFVRWISDLEGRYGLKIETLDIEPQSKPGVVDIRLSLSRT